MKAADRILAIINARCIRENVFKAKCPAHKGQSNTSLVITITDDRVLIHCFAGCSLNSILSALGMESSKELFDGERIQPIDSVKTRARTGLAKWCDRRLEELCKELRDLDSKIGLISKKLAPYAFEHIPHHPPAEEELWIQLQCAYQTRTELENEFEVFNGRDDQAKLSLWRAQS